jgi:hypothetical protein
MLGIALACASLVLRRTAPAALCLTAWFGLAVAALLSFGRVPSTLTELLALGSYAWVSRDAEIPLLVTTYVVASIVGRAFAIELERDAPLSVRPSRVLLIVTFLFAWTYIQRIAIQLGLDFVHFDWGAGAFRQPEAPLWRIGAALVYKHGLARAAILFAVLTPLAAAYRSWVARGLLVVELARVATLVTMLYVSRGSFWTSMRVMGDLPHALCAVVVAAAAYAAVVVREGSPDVVSGYRLGETSRLA